jgi:hypothetical protein
VLEEHEDEEDIDGCDENTGKERKFGKEPVVEKKNVSTASGNTAH